MDNAQHTAEMYALSHDENIVHLLAWRHVKARAEAGGFNGLVLADFAAARKALGVLLEHPL